MSEYNILLKPTRIDEKWYEVPRITTCGVNKEIVKTWIDVINCSIELGYETSDDNKRITKEFDENNSVSFVKEGHIFFNDIPIFTSDYNKMVLFMLLLENKL